jgi:hypothetical protein
MGQRFNKKMNTIQELIEQIKALEKKLAEEIQHKEAVFFYRIRGKKIYFEDATKRYHDTLRMQVLRYLAESPILNILTAPIIWSCALPALFMDLVVSLYQAICFPIYKIPKVRREDYIIIDRHSLRYLNIIEKINCVYCAYFNGLINYVQEVAARTEQYWCPIKHARRVKRIHSRYKKFLEYGDAKTYRENLEKIRRDFSDLN